MYKLALIDDDALEIEVIKLMISSLENEIELVGVSKSGEEAIENYEKLNPDIILLSDDIPGISFLEVLKNIKSKDEDKIVIIIKGCNKEFLHEDIKKSNYVDYCLLKPIDKNELLKVLTDKIINLKTNPNNLKEKEFMLLDHIMLEEKDVCKSLLKEIIRGYTLTSNNDLALFREKVIKLVKNIIKVCCNVHIGLLKEIDNKRYIDKINSKEDIECINDVIHELFNLIFKDKKDINITEKLINGRSINKNIQPIFKYIEENYKEKITLEEAASICNLNMYYFSKLFKKDTNIKFVDYVTLYKMEKAKEILKYTDESIVNIAIHLGYDESGYFFKGFLREL
ncbi:helix-turn-helix domain-containing protein [Clostridium novyi]|uniref:helix-turn-helix domain-containing protein n=1 Tax=Clostridium novyi TaxID=1542 RepID=UPI000AF58D34|nr:helix-turn-helix domain-containing protein [Clostridium novyi]